MSWAALKAQTEWDWRQVWRDVAAGTGMGEGLTETQVREVAAELDQLDCLYAAVDVKGFIALVSALVNRPWWRGSRPSWLPSLAVASASSTGASTTSANPTLWEPTEDSILRSNVSRTAKSRPRSKRRS